MKLIDLISVITDNTTVYLWRDGEIISTYDGKDSIDEKYNNEIVLSVYAGNYNIINIEI